MTACLELNTMPCTYTDGVSKKLYQYMIWPKTNVATKYRADSLGLEASLKAISRGAQVNRVKK